MNISDKKFNIVKNVAIKVLETKRRTELSAVSENLIECTNQYYDEKKERLINYNNEGDNLLYIFTMFDIWTKYKIYRSLPIELQIILENITNWFDEDKFK